MATVTVISPDQLEGNGEITRPGVFRSWGDYERHYLAEGDSWFSLSDILSPSFLYRLGNPVPLKQDTLIVNCAYPGDTLARMVDWSTDANFSDLLARKNFGWKWDGILLSAGGNDIIEAALAPDGILKSCPSPSGFSDFIDETALDALETHLRYCFQRLVRLRDNSEISANRAIPIHYHSYGYPTPRNAPASVSGPWLHEAFTRKAIPVAYWNDLSDALMGKLSGILHRFDDLGANLHLADTLADVPLVRADADSTGSSGDWLNEIHLNDAGKDKIAAYWADFL
ncbi:MAG: hypothetical protein IPM27_00855 [Nitrosomonadales bacterium]|nr:hypothetical protein [Nitrosomonadales bacterium]